MEFKPSHPESLVDATLMERMRAGLQSENGGRLKTVIAAAALTLSLCGFSDAKSGNESPVPAPVTHNVAEHPLFGAHVPGIGTGEFPDAPIESVRLWDSGTSWRELEPKRGQWDFTRLDKAVDTAQLNGADITLVLGQTPQWAAKYPKQDDNIYAKGASSPVEYLGEWDDYVTKVVKRYEGRIDYYEVWNEINLSAFYTGSDGHMVRLTRDASEIVHKEDQGAKLLSPSVLLRSGGPRNAMDDFIAAGGLKYVDIISVHGYPKPDGTPEEGAAMIRAFQDNLPKEFKDIPIWNTEINYGLPWGAAGEAANLSPQEQAGYVVRTLLLQADADVQRVFWYSWFPDKAPFLSVNMMNPKNGQKSEAGRAFGAVVKWLKYGKYQGCEVGDNGGRTCTINYANGDQGTVRWNPNGIINVPIPQGTTDVFDASGKKIDVTGRDSLLVGGSPIMMRVASSQK